MDSIIAISEQSKAPLVQAGIHSEKIDVILNCVDLSVFQPAPVGTMSECSSVPSAVRAEFSQGRSTSPFIIGIVGRIEPFKRQKAFVEIANEVFAQCKNVRFHIIGAALDMAEHRTYQREVRELVAKYQLNEAICFAGAPHRYAEGYAGTPPAYHTLGGQCHRRGNGKRKTCYWYFYRQYV